MIPFLSIIGSIIFIKFLIYLLRLWSYKQLYKKFYDGRPKAWYPSLTKPTFFNYKIKKQ